MNLIESNRIQDIAWANKVKELVEQAQGDYAARISDEIKLYSEQKITVAVVGLMKRGKSTFCNAFLNRSDDELAPIGKFPATGIISRYCSDSTRQNADVKFADGTVLTVPYAKIREYVTEEYNPENRKGVEIVTVYGGFGFDNDVVLMDMPGDGSIHTCHTEIVYRYLPQADVIIFLSSAQDPIQAGELALLKKVDRKRNNIFFVINKVDQYDDDDEDRQELADAEEHDKKVLENAQIPLVRPLYKISAKNALEGKESYDLPYLLDDIRNFLLENKIQLLRGAFVSRVIENALPALNMLETSTKLKKLELTDLNKALQELEITAAEMRKKADCITKEFLAHWKQMVDEFAASLPQAEANVQTRVKSLINELPMLGINDKILHKLPDSICAVVEEETGKFTQAFEDQVRAEVSRLNQEFPSISRYLADENYRIRFAERLGFGVGSSIFGGILLSGSALVGGGIASALGSLSAVSITIPVVGVIPVGGTLASALGVLAFPLTALSVIGMVGGGLFLAVPVFGWLRGKKRQKKELLDSAEAAIENAFRSMRNQKIPELERKAHEFTDSLQAHFESELSALEQQLQNAVQHKKELNNEVDTMQFRKQEDCFDTLTELIEEGKKNIQLQ